MIKYTLIALTSLFLIVTMVKAQGASTKSARMVATAAKKDTAGRQDTVKHKKASLKVGLTYSNNTVWLARTDSVAIPNYGVGLTYTLKSGLFFSGSVSYVPSRQFDKIDAGNFEAGYNFDVNNLSGSIAVSKYVAAFNSTQVISALDASVGAGLSYNLFDIITPSVHADYALVKSNGNDFMLSGGLSHEFDFEKVFAPKDNLSIEPKFEMIAGSQNFLSTYYTLKKNSAVQRQLHKNGNGKGKGATTTTTTTATTTTSNPVTTNNNKFQTLAYEYTLPIGYSWKKVGFSFTPAYAVAVHQITDDGTTTTYQPNSSVFYFQIGLSYTF